MLPRQDRATLAQLRSCHSLLAKRYRHKIGKEDSPLCNVCNEEETIRQVFKTCSNYIGARIKHFGGPSWDDEVNAGTQALAFVKEIGLQPTI